MQTETTPSRGTGEGIQYLQGFMLPRETQAAYTSLSQTFPLNYGPLQVVKNPRLVLHELKTGADPMDPLATLDFDELAENGKSL